MKLDFIRSLNSLRRNADECAVTIGNFDGLHLGHQALAERTLDEAARLKVTPAAVIFEPHPREYFAPQIELGRVFSLREKLDALSASGIERVLCLRFDRRLSELSADDFIQRTLVDGLHARSVIVGEDFRFGARRVGDVALLRSAGLEHGFEVSAVAAVSAAGGRVSSTRLRKALAEPDFALAEHLLGRRYRMHGRVRGGLKLGRKLDMPTANLLRRTCPALRHGVYAVRAACGGGPLMPGVASLGVRPTLNLDACLLETHLFDFSGDLYGRILDVEFEAFLRPQLRFDDLDALQVQMHKDAEQSRALLAKRR